MSWRYLQLSLTSDSASNNSSVASGPVFGFFHIFGAGIAVWAETEEQAAITSPLQKLKILGLNDTSIQI